MTRLSICSWRARTAAIALIAAFLVAPLAASPALADGWGHRRDESHQAQSQSDRDQHFDRDDWRRPVVVAPAPVYAAPVYAPSSAYAPPPPPAIRYAAPVVASRAVACSNGAVAGGLIGAATGGIIGSQFGHGSGSAAATLVGILGGAAVGASVGQSAAGCY
jgi:uncharacterized protein YcfJ